MPLGFSAKLDFSDYEYEHQFIDKEHYGVNQCFQVVFL